MKPVDSLLRAHRAYTPNDECFFIFLDVSSHYVARLNCFFIFSFNSREATFFFEGIGPFLGNQMVFRKPIDFSDVKRLPGIGLIGIAMKQIEF